MNNLNTQARQFLKLMKKNETPNLESVNLKELRKTFTQAPPEASKLFVEREHINLAKIEDHLISVEKNTDIKVRVYTPKGKGPFPIFIYYHGGGWVIGDLEWSDATCRMISEKINCLVISVDYRLAPENKFPIPLNDAYEAFKWITKNYEKLNGSISKLIIGGDSSGGNLANAVSMLAKKNNDTEIITQILIYPVTNMTFDTKSYEKFQLGYGLDKEKMIWYSNQYINDEHDKKNEYINPILSNHLTDLPSTLIIVAENDVLRDDILLYAQHLKESKVKVKTIYEEGLIHGYFTNMDVFQENIKNTIEKIKNHIISEI